jgi:hypothetical protein
MDDAGESKLALEGVLMEGDPWKGHHHGSWADSLGGTNLGNIARV